MATVYHASIPVNLAAPSRQRLGAAQFYYGDNDSHVFTALVADSTDPDAGLRAGTVSGTALRADGVTVPLEGEKGEATETVTFADGQQANATPCSVTLPQAAFAIPGTLQISIKLTDGTTATTVLSITGTVIRTETDTAVDPGEIIPDLATLQAAAAEALEAAEAAEDAAADARSAAQSGVRYDAAQSLTDPQKEQARANIGAADAAVMDAVIIAPENYADISASDLVLGSSSLVGHVTVQDNAGGGVDITNASGANGYVGLALSDLGYTTGKTFDIKVTFANNVNIAGVSVAYGMSEGSTGTKVADMTVDASDANVYGYAFDTSSYNYAQNGVVYVRFFLNYSQTTAVNVKITAYEQGATYQINNEALVDIGQENLDSELSGKIDTLDGIVEDYQPTNYGQITAASLVIGASALSENVTATDNAGGGVDLINESNTNGIVGFPLPSLAYGTYETYDLTLKFTNYTSLDNVSLRYAMASGSTGTSLASFAQDPDDAGTYHLTFCLRDYRYYSTQGNLFVAFRLAYDQRSAVNVLCSAIVHGETAYQYINPEYLHQIDGENLSDNLAERIGITPTTYSGRQICVFNKGLAVGDSLTAGVFNIGASDAITDSRFSYPAKLAQMTGIDFVNLGNGGMTSAEWWATHENDDLSGYQFAIVQLGVNDAIYNSGWTAESETAFTNIIGKLQDENSGIFVFVSTIIPATAYSGAAYDSVSSGIRELVEALDDDHVILLDMAVYGNTGKEPAYNSGHLTAIGYERLAMDYISFISLTISQNYELFRKVQFIGTEYDYPT